MTNYCPFKPYPYLTKKQEVGIREIAPVITTWSRDYIIEYENNCK